ncbi:TRAP transporter large permease [Natrinema versiforme]|uniref:TRAP dicarboxylate transporter subunit DctM n=1 Tax=Natrinema versiforme JCM 10478 TaxID=1227496 RepID=L9XN60_9EURY|nr:TRAP transporter large permease [Natrinema versiforme]ELY63180.1 TRAP dicarboxylate transporter subunit DctM [Natrinema versiforme JCM 10478]
MELLLIGLIFLGGLLFLYALGMPVAVAIGSACVLIMLSPFGPALNYGLMSNQLMHGLNSFTLLAVPFYLMLGRLMNRTDMTSEVFDFANAIFGRIRGGIAQVNIGASVIFSGMSGLAVADAAGLGRVEYNAMRDQGYDKKTAIGVTGASSIIGPIIPPSVPIILYGVLAEESIGALFLAGIVPGLLLAGVLSVFTYLVVRWKGYGKGEAVGLRTIGHEFVNALPALIIPVFIVGGILSGMFTATEAGAVAVVYAIGLGFYQGSLTGGVLLEEFRDGMVETFSILFIISLAMLYGLVALQLRIPILLADAITGFTTDPTVAILIFVPLFMLIGTFMSITATIMIMVPILMPIIETLGIDPIHFGIVMILSLMTGVVTPPLGSVLFVLEKVTDASLETVMRAMVLFYIPLLIVILIVALVPEVSVYVPNNYFF